MNKMIKMLVALCVASSVCMASGAEPADEEDAITPIDTSSNGATSSDAEDVYVTEDEAGYSDGPAPETKDKDSSIVRKKRGFLGFGTDLPPQTMGEGSIFLQGIMSTKVSQHKIAMLYYPSTDFFTLKFRYQAIVNLPRFDFKTRERLRKAYAIYEKDFESHKLDAKNKHSLDAYGRLQGNVRWGAVTATSLAYPTMRLGYKIIKKGAYFTITYDDAVTENPGESKGEGSHFVKRTYFFTRAQMKNIIDLMDETVLAATLKVDDVKQENEDIYK